jgi:hypothetical protein
MLETLLDVELIRVLQSRGYKVYANNEARKTYSWHRSLPLPEKVNFEREAFARILGQLSVKDLEFRTKEDVTSAYLRLL